MRLPGLKTFKRSGLRLRARFSDHALILGYHRVAQVHDDPYRICVSPQHFAEHMEVLNLHGQAISLLQLTENIGNDRIPSRKVVVTFDDGYADICQHAKPLLEQYDIPAIVFVVTGFIGQVFWWDRLEAAYSSRPDLAGQLGGSQADMLLPMYRKLKDEDPDARERIIAQIKAPADPRDSGADILPRSMTVEEILLLSSSGLIEVGSHSTWHSWLASLSLSEQRDDISKSKSYLEEIIGKKVISFSYPNGSVSKDTSSIVQQLGFQCACTSSQDVVYRSSNLFHLPRIWVPDVDGEVFERWLSNW